MNENNYTVFYEDDHCPKGTFIIYDGHNFSYQDTIPKKGYYMMKDEANKQALKSFHKNVLKWRNDIMKSNDYLKMDYFQYDTHHQTAMNFFWRLTKKYRKNIKFQTITFKEHNWFIQCRNSGLMYANEKYKKKIIDCVGYDFSSFYTTILGGKYSKFQIPFQVGSFSMLNSLPEPKDIKYGIYRVIINPLKKKSQRVFAFNPKNHYTHFDLKYAFYLQKLGLVSIELIQDGNENALIYEDKKLVSTKSIFWYWFRQMNDIKNKCKGNPLIKHAMNAVWGSLCSKDKIVMLESEFDELSPIEQEKYELINRSVVQSNDIDKLEWKLVLVKRDKVYKYQFRMMPFLTSYGVKKMGSKILPYIDQVVRVQTDGVIFKSKNNVKGLEKGEFTSDKKYSKKLIIRNVNRIKCGECQTVMRQCKC